MENAPLIYSNGFQLAISERGEVYLTFLQETPKFDESNKVTSAERKTVSRLVLPSHLAQTLADALGKAGGDSHHE